MPKIAHITCWVIGFITPNIMNLEDNTEEAKAIKSLERAFKKCADLGLKFSVMDDVLNYANKRLYKECLKIEDSQRSRDGVYPTVAYAQDTELGYCVSVNCHDSMGSCGGW